MEKQTVGMIKRKLRWKHSVEPSGEDDGAKQWGLKASAAKILFQQSHVYKHICDNQIRQNRMCKQQSFGGNQKGNSPKPLVSLNATLHRLNKWLMLIIFFLKQAYLM